MPVTPLHLSLPTINPQRSGVRGCLTSAVQGEHFLTALIHFLSTPVAFINLPLFLL